MDFYLGLAQIVGVHTLLGLSAYCVLLTGQVSLAQAGFFAIGAYVAAMLTVLAGWHILPAIVAASFVAGVVACAVGFPALRVKGLMLVVATLAFGEAVRLFFFNFDYQVARGEVKIGPAGGEGFRQIRFFPEHGWSTLDVLMFIWLFVALATFAIAYPILGGLSSVFGTLIAVIFVQGFLIEGLRFLGDWRNLLFGGLILLAMNVRPRGLIDAATIAGIKRLRIRNREPGNARTQGAE